MRHLSNKSRFIWEGLTCLAVFSIAWFISGLDMELDFSPKYDLKILLVIFFVSALFYFVSRIVFSRIISLLAVLLGYGALFYISFEKYRITWEPLLANDFNGVLGYRTVMDFAGFWQKSIVVLFLLMFVFYLFRSVRSHGVVKLSLKFLTFLAAVTIISLGFSKLKTEASGYAATHGVVYDSWDFAANIKRNGLILHLLQTAVRTFPDSPTVDDRAKFVSLMPGHVSRDSTHQFVLIQCESCWYDADNLRGPFEGLINKATAEFRSVSPVFGGGTSNAELETLTGLPVSKAPINGIIYREYRKDLSSHAVTMASILRENGYKTYTIHNSFRANWSRHEVVPKMGFDKFISFEDMNATLTFKNWLTRDSHVFDEAKAILDNPEVDRTFIHALTVYTHGPWEEVNGDSGTGDYLDRLQKTTNDTLDFIEKVGRTNPGAIVMLYGDHRPALPNMPWEYTQNRDIPVLLFDPNVDRAKRIAKLSDGKPLYCLSAFITQEYFGFALPAAHYTAPGCKGSSVDSFQSRVPDWVYYLTLFDETQNY